ncbi:unnamed protein product [Adineta steineri]|uniref:Uncharacterized protein n=1 Tax=Adineta steineri TaxID=433720 RepID=A0A815HQS2_9BILA|nr:unnamed protein product [Adineta steineri]CAF3560826.1 unnamed protein product [Adineta steineri]
MLICSSYIIVILNIFGLVLTTPVKQISLNEKIGDNSLEQAFRNAEKTLHRYYYLMKSDTDHLVHGMLHILMNNPTSFPFIPYRAMNIAFKNVEEKLGSDEVETLTKPLLLAIEQNYQAKSKQPSTFKLTDETKEKIENALDKFLDEEEFDHHL